MRVFLVFLAILAFGTFESFSRNSIESLDWIKVNPKASFENFDWSVLPSGASKEMVISLLSSPYVSGNEHITLFPIDGKVYALFPCRFEVLLWTGVEWKNLYKGYSAGLNCQPFFFVRNGQIYSYGKYGFWRAHSELIYFDFKTGFWENSPSKNIPSNYAGVVPFIVGDKLVTILGQYIYQSAGIDVFEKNGFHYDFKTGEWFPLEVKIPNQPIESNWMVPSFDLGDFGVHLYKYQAELGLLVLDKRDFSLYFKRMDFTPIRDNALSFAKSDELWFFGGSGSLIYFNFEDDLKKSFHPLGNIELKEEWPSNPTFEGFPLKNWLIGFLIVGLITSIFYRFRSKVEMTASEEFIIDSEPKELSSDQADEEINKLIGHLSGFSNQSFDVDGFDRLLGIDKIDNLDYRRVKRNRLIKELNEYALGNFGKPIIERTRSESDKRVVTYLISIN